MKKGSFFIMSNQQRFQKPIMERSSSIFLDNCKFIKSGITNHWSKLRTKNEILPCPFNTCSSKVCTQENTYVKPSNGDEKWALPCAILNNPGKKIDPSKKNNRLKVDILKRKYWYEEPKPLKFYNKYSMGAKTFFLGLSDAPRS